MGALRARWLAQRCLVPCQQRIQVRQKKAGRLPSIIQVASLACLRRLGHVTAEDVKGVSLHHDPWEPPTRHAHHGVVPAVCEQPSLNALHRTVQPDITS
ncbi:hypothetical protein ACN6LD_004328 [Streptomyces sp. SAS_272]